MLLNPGSRIVAVISLTLALVTCQAGDNGGGSGGPDPRPQKLTIRPGNAACIAPSTSAEVAATLSTTGCFEDATKHEVAAGVIPYTVNNLLFSDGEKKGRYFAIPDGTSIGLLPDGHFDFPVGSVVIKTFRKDSTRLETRFLMNHAVDGWVGYAYKWNLEQTDADLLTDSDSVTVGSYVHEIPSPEDCMECHLPSGNDAYVVIGNETLQQNYDLEYNNDETENFLDALDRLGFFTLALDPSFKQSKLTALGEKNASLHEQAKSYLHTNCSGCHRPETFISGHNFRYPATLVDGLCGMPSMAFPGSGPNPMIISPGDAENSAVIARMATNDPDYMMPPLGRATVDEDALAVLTQWIEELEDCN